jgi:glucokinase
VEALKGNRLSSLRGILEDKGDITSRQIFEYVDAGDELAAEIADGTARALAILCVNLVHTTGPELILFSGGMTAAGETLISRIRRFFDETVWNSRREHVKIAIAALGEDAGIVGTAALAREAG